MVGRMAKRKKLDSKKKVPDKKMKNNPDCGDSFEIEMSKVKGGSSFNRIVNPLEIYEVVENVLKYCSQDDILNCRKVSQLWNEAAVSVLKNTSELPLQCQDLYVLSCAQENRKTFQQLQTILNKTKHPEILFKNVRILAVASRRCAKIATTKAVKISLRLSPTQKMLQQFGTHVKILKAVDEYELNFLKNCLGPNRVFPNVEVLKVWIVNDRYKRVETKFALPPFLDAPRVLKVKELHFFDKYKLNPGKRSEMLIRLQSFVGKCFELNTLHLETNLERTLLYIKLLQKIPQITKKLKKLYISGSILENWEDLCKIQFSTKLKTIIFNEMQDFQNIGDANKGLTTFLRKHGQSLESLKITSNSNICWIDVRSIPFMPNLKKLSWPGDGRKIGSDVYTDFLRNLPNLQELRFNKKIPLYKFLKSYFETGNTVEIIPGLSNYIPKFTHQHLEKINSHKRIGQGWDIFSPTTIKLLNAVFPNFSQLDIGLLKPPEPLHGSWIKGKQLWFEELLCAISEMKNLKYCNINLSLGKCSSEVYFGILDLRQAFAFLKETPNLQELILSGFNIEDRRIRWLENLKALIDAPKLRKISVYLSSKVKDKNLKKGMKKLVKNFAAKNITLKYY